MKIMIRIIDKNAKDVPDNSNINLALILNGKDL